MAKRETSKKRHRILIINSKCKRCSKESTRKAGELRQIKNIHPATIADYKNSQEAFKEYLKKCECGGELISLEKPIENKTTIDSIYENE